MTMNEHTTIYPLSEVEPMLDDASIFYVNGVFLLASEITDDPNDYDDSDQFALAQDCFLRFSHHESEWEEVSEIFFPRNRNQEVTVKHGFVFYLYDNFGVEHEVIGYSAVNMEQA
jgi:hypothetical protein